MIDVFYWLVINTIIVNSSQALNLSSRDLTYSALLKAIVDQNLTSLEVAWRSLLSASLTVISCFLEQRDLKSVHKLMSSFLYYYAPLSQLLISEMAISTNVPWFFPNRSIRNI